MSRKLAFVGRSGSALLLLAGLLGLLIGPCRAGAQIPVADSFNPSASSNIVAFAVQADGRIVVGGNFTTLGGQTRNYLGRLNADGSLDTTFNPGANASVTYLALQPDGKILVGGNFTILGGQTRNYLGRLNADGSLDTTFNPVANSGISAPALQPDGKIVVGGWFTTLGGQARSRIGRLNADGSLDASFDPGVEGTNSVYVWWLAVQPDGKILVAGKFQTLAGQPCNGFGRLNGDGSLDTTFDAKVSVAANALVLQGDGKILVAGKLSAPDGQTRSNLGRLNADGSLDAAFDPKFNGYAFSLAVQADGKILVGGQFTTLGGQARSNLGRLNADGSLDTGFTPSVDMMVSALAVQPDGRILAGGNFRTLGGQLRKGIGRLNSTEPPSQSLRYEGSTLTWQRGGAGPEVLWALFDYSTNGLDWTRLGVGTRVAGGTYQLGGVSLPSNATARARGSVCATGGLFNGASSWWVEQMSGPPAVSSFPESSRVMAGATVRFNVAAGGSEPLGYQWRKEGVALADGGDIAGTSTPVLSLSNVLKKDEGGYNLVISNPSGSVTSIVAMLSVVDPAIAAQPLADNDRKTGQGLSLDVGGIGTAPLAYQWWKDNQALAQGRSASLLLTNLQMSDAGNYWVVVSNLYGSVTSMVARVGVTLPVLDTTFNPGSDSFVRSFALQADGRILVGGEFSALGGQPRNGLGRLHGDGSLDTAFNPEPNSGNYPSIYSLVVQPDGKVLVGGIFFTLGGQPHSCLGRLHADGSLDTSFNGGTDFNVYSLAVQPDGKVLVGGYFFTLGGQPCNSFGRLKADGSLDTSFNPRLQPRYSQPIVNSLVAQADGKILVGGSFTELWGQPCNNLGRLHTDGSLDTSFDPGANNPVYCLAVQADGKILVGGSFTNLAGQARSYLGRLNTDGSLDTSFNPEINGTVGTLAVQADGKILVGGSFTRLGGQPRSNLGRLQADGSLDSTFNPGASYAVYSLALQADGKVLVGGYFKTLDGQACTNLGRLNSTEPALQSLKVNGSTLTWWRGGSSPEVWRTTFDLSTNGVDWIQLGSGTRIAGGWQLTGVSLPSTTTNLLRARGYVSGGSGNSSSWFVESQLPVNGVPTAPPGILANQGGFGFSSNGFGFHLGGAAGQIAIVEASTNLAHWLPLATNSLGATPLYYNEPSADRSTQRFYRVRLWP